MILGHISCYYIGLDCFTITVMYGSTSHYLFHLSGNVQYDFSQYKIEFRTSPMQLLVSFHFFLIPMT